MAENLEEEVTDEPGTEAGPAEDAQNEQEAQDEEEKEERIGLHVDIDERGPCQRHLKVTVPRPEVERFFDKEFSDLVKNASVPGFRKGKTPRKLIERRFQKDVGNQVKATLIMQSLEQIGEEEKIEPLSEPNIDIEAIELPEDGDFVYEFDVEVRPEFDLPEYRGLTVDWPVKEFADADIDKGLEAFLRQRGELRPKEGAAVLGDYLTVDIRFVDDGQVVNEVEGLQCRVDEELVFRDGRVERFAEQMAGVAVGDSRDLRAKLSDSFANPAMRGKELDAIFVVMAVHELQVPEVNQELFGELDVADEGELRDLIQAGLERRLHYTQQRSAREQIIDKLLEGADWDLPPDLLRRQAERAFRREISELQNAGFSDEEIRTRVNILRQNSIESTSRLLKRQFVLQRISETEDVKVEEEDLERYIQEIAQRAYESPRRVRARIEKEGLWESVAAEVLEAKTLEWILTQSEKKNVPYEEEELRSAGLDESAMPEEPEPAESAEPAESSPAPEGEDQQ